MNVVRYDPFDVFDGLVKSVLRPAFDVAQTRERFGSMPVDIMENDDAFIVCAELPGVRKDDVTISVDGRGVTITAEVKQENAVDQGQGKQQRLLSERRYGTLSRTLVFGVGIDDAKAEATYRDGLLLLKLPKSESARPKRLTIH